MLGIRIRLLKDDKLTRDHSILCVGDMETVTIIISCSWRPQLSRLEMCNVGTQNLWNTELEECNLDLELKLELELELESSFSKFVF